MSDKKKYVLVSKLIRIEEKTIAEIDELKESLYKDEHISFSAMVRRLLRVGIDSLKKETKWVIKKWLVYPELLGKPDHT